MRIRIRTLKHLAFRWWVFFGFNLLAPSTFWRKVFALFVVLGGGTVVFTFWAFRLIEQQEAEVHHRSEQLSALQQVVDQARTLARAKYGALRVLEKKSEFSDQFLTSGITKEQSACYRY